jgi:hypothetical protein
MSGSDYFKDQDELAAAAGMSARQVRKYTQIDGFPSKTKSGYPKQRCLDFIKAQQKQGLTGDGSLRDEKILREIKRLDIIIERERGELVNRKEEEARFRAEWSKARKAVEDWRSHETAKHPDHAGIINELADRLCEMVRDA